MMTLEEARERVQICNGHIKPRNINGEWVCDNCGVGLTEEKRNRSGFCHFYAPDNEKECVMCHETKHITDFYYRDGALDKHYSYCKACARSETARRETNLNLRGKTRHIWLPDDLMHAVHKIRGRQTFRDFIVVAVRKEVERRTKDLVLRQAVEGIKSKKPARHG